MGWMDGWRVKWDGRMDVGMDGWRVGLDGCRNGWMEGRIGWM